MTEGLTAVSLFAGVGGFDLAMERNGIEVVATVEKDKKASAVLQRHFPRAEHFGDIKEVTSEQLRNSGFVPDRGVLTGGFPCQDLSTAGRRAGLAGGRSGLFWEIVRLASELAPRYLILENVPGLLSSPPEQPGRDFGTVLGALVELGYGLAYRILDAQFFGVAQRRERVFIVCCLGDDGRTPFEILALGEGLSGDSAPSRPKGQALAAPLGASAGSGGYRLDLDQDTYVPIYDSKSPDESTGTSPTLLARMGTGGVNVPLTLAPAFVKTRRAQSDEDDEGWVASDVAPTLNSMDNTGDSRATVIAFSHNAAADNGESEEVWPTLHAQHQGGGPAVAHTLTGHHGRLTGDLDNFVIDEPVHTLTERFDSSEDGTGRGVPLTTDGWTVRRLTPMECERLQGFPDGWTEGQVDSARYRQMGNAVAVPVIAWIVKNLIKAHERDLTKASSQS
jgi:DNA (cytosine-5)-methyltransferase 1